MLPREQHYRRKEVIARKRLERAQGRDGLTLVDMREVSALMRAFSEEEERFLQVLTLMCNSISVVVDCGKEEGSQRASRDSATVNSAGEPGAEAASGGERICNHPKVEEREQGTEFPLHELSVEELVRIIDGTGAAESSPEGTRGPSLELPPLDGVHLKAVKRIAGYLRLAWELRGGGARKVLVLRRMACASPPDLVAVEDLLKSLEETEKGALTKRLPRV